MKSIKRIGFLSAFIIPSLVVLGYYLGGGWNYLTIIFVFFILPFFDYLIGLDNSNVPENEISDWSKKIYYKMVLFGWVYIQLAFFFWGIYIVAFGSLSGWMEWVGFTLSFSLVTGGIGITVAHELGHKNSKIERFYSKALLMTVSYMHFYIEHNRGHHVYVATPGDPATARKGENFYLFWVRSVFKGYFHAWQLEKNRLNKKGKAALNISNQMIWFTILPILLTLFVTTISGIIANELLMAVPLFFLSQSILAFTLLELVNYVEHYGIMRKEISLGRYEKVTQVHSWNTNYMLSNFFLFQLQRHSDHHVHAARRYQVLQNYSESPQLPAGYPTMILLALIPPVWFRVLHKIMRHH